MIRHRPPCRTCRTGRRHPRSHGGYATLWALGWIACLLTVTAVALLLSGVVARQHHLDGSADLVAVSAASALHQGIDACAAAAQVSRANAVRLAECRLVHADVIVVVTDRLELGMGLRVGLVGRARAGPVSE